MAEHNELTELPEVSDSLRKLILNNNKLTALPELPKLLTDLFFSNNLLTASPQSLPQSLIRIDLSSNQIKECPGPLPRSLSKLNMEENRLSRLPDSLMSLDRFCQVNVINNPIPERVIRALKNNETEFYHQGPNILSSSMDDEDVCCMRWLPDSLTA